jgi:hypothetical protein
MNEIIGLIGSGQSRVESFRGKNVAGNDLRARADPGAEVLRTTRETTDLVALCFQQCKQAPADVSGCTRYENEITSIHLRLQLIPLSYNERREFLSWLLFILTDNSVRSKLMQLCG